MKIVCDFVILLLTDELGADDGLDIVEGSGFGADDGRRMGLGLMMD